MDSTCVCFHPATTLPACGDVRRSDDGELGDACGAEDADAQGFHRYLLSQAR
jgi:hypothetical protein